MLAETAEQGETGGVSVPPVLVLALTCLQGIAIAQVRVRVVRADLSPVRGAEVRWSTTGLERCDVATIDATREVVLTDEDGVAVLPAEPRPRVVVASAPGSWGWNHGTDPLRPQLVVLERDGDLEVETVDPDGRRLSNVPVVLRRSTEFRTDAPGSGAAHSPSLGALASDPWPWVVAESRAISNASGRAVLRHAVATRTAVERYSGDHSWRVALDALGPDGGAQIDVTRDAWERGTVRLVVEGTYELDVRFVDDGQPVRAVEWAALVASDESGRRRIRETEPSGGVARFRHLDESYEPLLRVRRNAVSVAVEAGPVEVTREGSRRSATFELGRGLAKVRARVTMDGLPLERVRIAGHPGSKAISVELALDPPGELRLDFQPWGWMHGVTLGEVDGDREAWIAPPVPGRSGAIELGEIELVTAPLAIAGFVTDETGAPLAGVDVVARRLGPADEFGDPASPDDPPLRAVTDERGQFALSTTIRASFRLELSSRAAFSELVEPVPTGTFGLQVVMRGPARLRGRVRFASQEAAGDVQVLALRVDGGVPIERAPGVSRGCACDGLFEFENLKAGRYILLVRRPTRSGTPIELARREGLVLLAGDTLEAGELRIE